MTAQDKAAMPAKAPFCWPCLAVATGIFATALILALYVLPAVQQLMKPLDTRLLNLVRPADSAT
jgi:hypothetical protein